jgi:hypothetical protein
VGKAWRNDDFCYRKTESISHWWFPYPISLKPQRSLKVEAREVEADLAEIVEEVQNFVFPDPADPESRPPTMNPQRALDLYNALIQWKFSLPQHLRFEEAVLPNVIILQYVYSFLAKGLNVNQRHSCSVEMICAFLLRPFAAFTRDQFGPFAPRERCLAHAVQMQSTIWTFRAYSILRHEYWLNSPITNVAFITMHESASNPMAMEALVKACQCLSEMSELLPLSADCLVAIHGAIKSSKLQLPEYVMRYFKAKNLKARKDGLMHRTIATILPGQNNETQDREQEVMLEELLDDFDGLGVD